MRSLGFHLHIVKYLFRNNIKEIANRHRRIKRSRICEHLIVHLIALTKVNVFPLHLNLPLPKISKALNACSCWAW